MRFDALSMPIFGYMAAFYPRWDHAYADRLRREFGLDTRTRVKELSKGQRARAGLTIALAYRPELLLLDEPSSGLDPIVRRDILGAIIRTVAEEGRTVVVPIVVVTGTRRGRDRVRDGFLPVWTAMHGEWVRTQPHGRHVLAEKSGHAIHIDEPDLVVGLIREVIDQARTRRGDPSKSLTFSK